MRTRVMKFGAQKGMRCCLGVTPVSEAGPPDSDIPPTRVGSKGQERRDETVPITFVYISIHLSSIS
eukprot:1749186-Pyramimonas_sp.AAC.1